MKTDSRSPYCLRHSPLGVRCSSVRVGQPGEGLGTGQGSLTQPWAVGQDDWVSKGDRREAAKVRKVERVVFLTFPCAKSTG